MAKPRLGKVRALFYVFQHEKEAAPILTQPHGAHSPTLRRKLTRSYERAYALTTRYAGL